jgi:hypothetical protein
VKILSTKPAPCPDSRFVLSPAHCTPDCHISTDIVTRVTSHDGSASTLYWSLQSKVWIWADRARWMPGPGPLGPTCRDRLSWRPGGGMERDLGDSGPNPITQFNLHIYSDCALWHGAGWDMCSLDIYIDFSQLSQLYHCICLTASGSYNHTLNKLTFDRTHTLFPA